MSKPIEGCPQPDEPMRERAYTDRQLLELAAKAAGYDTSDLQAALAQNAQTLGDFVRMPDADRVVIGQQVVDRAIEMQNAQGEAVVEVYRMGNGLGSLVYTDYGAKSDLPHGTKLYLHAERARVPESVLRLPEKWRSQGENIGPSVGHLARAVCADELDALLAAAPSRPVERARVPDISRLQRYFPSMPPKTHPGWVMTPASTGEWVLFSDVQAMLAAPSQPEDAA